VLAAPDAAFWSLLVLEALLPLLWPAALPLLWSLLDGVDAAPAAAPDD
jgi:hypothetical protein